MRRLTALFLLTAAIIGCSSSQKPANVITLATTTSTRDSGLLDVLVPMFEQQSGVQVKVVAVGSGQALELGRRGDADVLLTHAPAAEEEFIAEGFGSERRHVMYNDFVIVGPSADPAQIMNFSSVVEAIQRIAAAETVFVSRRDNSGTHQKELQLWQAAALTPEGAWYLQAGAGMAQTLRIASEKRAYALTDRATFLAHRDQLDLEILVKGDALLRNDYSVLLINPKKHPHLNHHAAQQFADFLLVPKTQQVIADFGRDKYRQALFFPHSETAQPPNR